MKSVRVTGKSQCEVIDRSIPSTKDDFVLIKVRTAAMCNEHNAYRDSVYIWGETPNRLGHEVTGEVVDAGRSSKFRVGDRVIANMPFYSCGSCLPCRAGALRHCQKHAEGTFELEDEADIAGFAQYTLRADWALILLPDDLSYRHAACALCGCGVAYAALEAMSVSSHSTVLVTGLGPVGLGAVLIAAVRGARVIGVGRQKYRRDLALELGAHAVVDPLDGDAVKAVRDLTNGHGVTAAIECSGQAEYLRTAIDSTGLPGQICALGEVGEFDLNVEKDLITHGRTLHGRLGISNQDIANLLTILGRIPEKLDVYTTHTFSIDDIEDAWKLQASRQCGKVLIDPWA